MTSTQNLFAQKLWDFKKQTVKVEQWLPECVKIWTYQNQGLDEDENIFW